ncbi:MAG TPA: hypothetical protein VFY80_02680, partial [Burkholderiales bacterium]|nr:hypothetical protein [Burkholderiales bacterium]
IEHPALIEAHGNHDCITGLRQRSLGLGHCGDERQLAIVETAASRRLVSSIPAIRIRVLLILHPSYLSLLMI